MGLSIVVNHQELNLEDVSDNLKTIFKYDFILKDDLESSKELIKLLPNLDMVILSHPNNKSENAFEVINALINLKKEIPLIVIGTGKLPDFDPKAVEILNVPTLDNKELLIETIAGVLGISIKKVIPQDSEDSENKGGDYVAININFLLKTDSHFFDIYEKEIVGESNIYQKLELPRESQKDILKNMINNGVSELYVTQRDYDKILAVKETIQEKDESLSLFEEKDLEGLSIKEDKRKEILAGLKKIGISPNTYEAVNDHIEKLFNRVEGFFALEHYLKKMFKDPKSFIYRKSHLVSFLGCQLLNNLQSENLEEAIPKWVFVSFFNDYPLLKKEEVIVRTEVELMGAKLDQKERYNVRRHPQLAVKALDECSNTPHGASTMILQHHGNNIGEGFPKFPHSTISPHAALFMVVEEFVVAYLTKKWKVPDIIVHIKNRLKYDKFKNHIENLEMTCHEHMRRS